MYQDNLFAIDLSKNTHQGALHPLEDTRPVVGHAAGFHGNDERFLPGSPIN